MYLLLDQSIQLLDVRSDERVKSDQNLLFRQGGQEETQSLHQPHALAALQTDTQEHIQHTSYMTVGAFVCTEMEISAAC